MSRADADRCWNSLDYLDSIKRSTVDAAAEPGIIAGREPEDPTSLLVPVPNPLTELGQGTKGRLRD
jgi:amidase